MDKIEVLNLGLTDSEFCRRLWLENPDPTVRRLLTMVEELSEWKDAFDDFKEPWEVVDKIRNCENEEDYLNEQLSEANQKLEDLEARTVLELIKELRDQIYQTDRKAQVAIMDAERARENEARMRSKLDMWAVLNS